MLRVEVDAEGVRGAVRLRTAARDFAPLAPVCVQRAGEGEVLGADVSLLCFFAFLGWYFDGR